MLTHTKTLEKVLRIERTYEALIFRAVSGIDRFWGASTAEHLRQVPGEELNGQEEGLPVRWGGAWATRWFKAEVAVPEAAAGKRLFLQVVTGAVETMLWVNGVPCGIFSKEQEVGARGCHHTLRIAESAKAGERIDLALECYAGHPCIGVHPMDEREATSCDPGNYEHVFASARLMVRDELVKDVVFDLKTLNQLAHNLPPYSFRRGAVVAVLERIFNRVPQSPAECGEAVWRPALEEARAIMAPELAKTNGASAGFAGIIGHSHMDTAWLWTTEETVRKCARTFSNALNLMEQYPEYFFMQSSVLHLEQMKTFYPQIFAQIKQRVAEGRWEPNGGSYVEADGNMPGGEAQIRQFTRGMAFLKQEFNYRPDSYWLPDTFGYSAALPQVIRGCGLKYFLTTKLSWNESNMFPHDTFRWQGIDGSEVVAHFNETHCWPDPATLLSRLQGIDGGAYNGPRMSIRHNEISDRRLIAYGFGDGGGGPMYEMLEMARRVEDLEGVPRTRNMRVGAFMDELVEACPNLPLYCGELYLELHRGTLTHQHQIKRGNRKLESALRALEYRDVMARMAGREGVACETLSRLWRVLLINQFHDILPGTSLPDVHDKAIAEYAAALKEIDGVLDRGNGLSEGTYAVHNALNWDRTEPVVVICPAGLVADSGVSQSFETIDAENALMVGGVTVPAVGRSVIGLIPGTADNDSAFTVAGDEIETPFYAVTLAPEGGMASLFFKPEQRFIGKANGPLNVFLCGEDVPAVWDSWDIDVDQRCKLERGARLKSREVVSNGAVHLRIRSIYAVGQDSRIVQDMVLYASGPRIDFETVVDWNEKHQLLKVAFDLEVFSRTLRSEVAFGYVDRPTHDNTAEDRAMFEVAQHKYSDLSESRFGVALLNDCKYGISACGSELQLTLLKSGGHPDPRGDQGRHYMTYSLLPHQGGFSVPAVVRPACELNHPLWLQPMPGAEPAASFCTLSSDQIIVESLKWADDGNGYVLRLYEAECNRCRCDLMLSQPGNRVLETNMLEENGTELTVKDHTVSLVFRPFEIKTIKVML
jgi:alpha-mannosidase